MKIFILLNHTQTLSCICKWTAHEQDENSKKYIRYNLYHYHESCSFHNEYKYNIYYILKGKKGHETKSSKDKHTIYPFPGKSQVE